MTEKPCEIQRFDKEVDLESKFGEPGGIRTLDLRIRSPVPYPNLATGSQHLG